MYKYQRNITWCDSDSCFVALVPELEGCTAHGSTPEQALENINLAIELWIEVAQENGWDIPKPKEFLEVA